VRFVYSALNLLLQSTGALVMKKAMVILDANLQAKGFVPGTDYEFCANIHDEWQIEAREEIAEEVGKMMVEAIRQAGEYFKFRCPLDGEYKVGNNWKETTMGNSLAVFEYTPSNASKGYGMTVRTIKDEQGKAWFVAKDVCAVLEYVKSQNAVLMHCKYPKIYKGPDLGLLTTSPRGITIIPKSDVYRLVLKSYKPEAVAFQDWIVEEVIPTIEETGRYEVKPQYAVPQTYSEALRLAADQAEKIVKQEEELAIAAPKVAEHDRFMNGKNNKDMGTVAKELNIGIGRSRLFEALRNRGNTRTGTEFLL
jgi:prophage antirepressor-like protein